MPGVGAGKGNQNKTVKKPVEDNLLQDPTRGLNPRPKHLISSFTNSMP
jgi:hypothetical protein